MSGPLLSEVLSLRLDPQLRQWDAAGLDGQPIEEIGDLAGAVWERVAKSLARDHGPNIHPTAWISPLANIGADVIIGPGAKVYEFSTVRNRSVLGADVTVGYGCEVSRTVLGSGTALAHRAMVSCSVIGQHVHFASQLTIAPCLLTNPDMRHPTRPIAFGLPDGTRLDSGQPKWGALVGDEVRAGIGITLGPGTVIGARSLLHGGVAVSTAWIPADSCLYPPTRLGYQRETHSEGAPS